MCIRDSATAVLKPAAEEAGEDLSDIDQQIAQAIKTARDNLPAIAKRDVQKLWYTIKSDPFKENNIFDYNLKDAATDAQTFVSDIKQMFRIVDETVNYTSDETSALTYFILNKCIVAKPKPNTLDLYANVYITRAMSKITNKEVDFKQFVDSTIDLLDYPDDFNNSKHYPLSHSYTDEKEFCNAISGDNSCDDFAALKSKDRDEIRASIKKLLNDAANEADSFEIKTESRFRRVKPLARRVKSLQVIKEAKFLEQEFKRLWNLR